MGDVVTVRHPMFPWMGASKRVLGMPGDFVIRGTPGGGSGGEGEQMMVQVCCIAFCFEFLCFVRPSDRSLNLYI